MASVNIPFGGATVTVTIPDFAMEGTQQDVLEQASRQTDALQKIASSMGISLQNDQKENKSNRDLLSQLQKSNKDNLQGLNRIGRGAVAQAQNISNAIQKSGESNKLSDMVGKDGLLGTLGLGVMGAQIGTLFGILEEFGSAMGALRRTGGGLGADLLELRSQASLVGIDMQTLSKITVENGDAIRALGTSTVDGTTQFLQLNKMLYDTTKDMGFFGMSSKEMSNLLIDEIELRRGTRNAAFLEGNTREQLVSSMKESLKLNEVMAGLNGQDIQDRIKARNEFRKNAVVAAVQANMTKKQLDAQNELVSGLSGLGSIGAQGGPIQQALINAIGGVGMDVDNTQFTELANAASGFGINLRDTLEEAGRLIKSESDPKKLTSIAQELVNQFANIDVKNSGITERALSGQEGANLLLQTRMESFASSTKEGKKVSDQVNDNLNTLEDAAGKGAIALSGMTTQIGTASTLIKDVFLKSMMNAFGIDPNDPKGIMKFVNNLEAMPQTAQVQRAVEFLTELTTAASGSQGLMTLLGVSPDRSKYEKGAEVGLFAMAVTRSLGISGVGLEETIKGFTEKNSKAGSKKLSKGQMADIIGGLANAALIATAMYNRFQRTPLPVVITNAKDVKADAKPTYDPYVNPNGPHYAGGSAGDPELGRKSNN